MYSLIIFSILTLIEFLIVWSKWSDVKDYQNMASGLANYSGLDKKKVFTTTVTVIGNVLRNFRTLLIIPVGIILFVNLVVSIVIGTILSFFF